MVFRMLTLLTVYLIMYGGFNSEMSSSIDLGESKLKLTRESSAKRVVKYYSMISVT